MVERSEPDVSALIAELPAWNGGAGIDAESWIGCSGTYDLFIGYSLIFWPKFVRFERYVLREGFSVESLRGFERATGNDRAAIESVMNHVHLIDIHVDRPATEAQIRYLGRILKEIYEVKLRRDIPECRFIVSFNDEAELDPVDYVLTFIQADQGR